MPNPLYVLSVPLILTSPSLTIGVTRKVTPLKSLITFLVLYIPTLLLLNAGNTVIPPWFVCRFATNAVTIPHHQCNNECPEQNGRWLLWIEPGHW
ncbi:hypothetical protein [Vulcanisaeta souniana]|uniref:hypothetical protein n=1 Tax=Vulcanisaeta souniana TaxID=164452 RepID=UPI000AF361E8|nr:hypothetical protein [Vulcanisaeta souniana]